MRRKTIGRNPLDDLSAPRAKGRGKAAKKAVPASREVQSEIREAILRKRPADKRGPLTKWLESVIGRLAG